jgi:hypothetical protein
MPLSNHYKQMKMLGAIDFQNDSFIMVLMDDLFNFDQDVHATLADIQANLLPDGNGYSPAAMVIVSVDEDDTNDRSEAVFNDVSWTASGGNIGPANGAIIYDDTVADDTVVGFIDFGTAQMATDGGVFRLTNLRVRES